ncbi:helix-turn-helix transcriptional regulator [Nonomuraea sp. K274]|uniref:Helix-turn-helix transcriptional regulator n=1 Tax=Nonomuraea cypriaca TaxID=1187855 RepID=A0A931AD37_9ACTN|nr:helix-turn-helix transcriptional regulator [Nonomuraea cypriaca]MBF8188313.1 helix-turn-helix transcriptional regulator [Nonomuraea cypriaca]
MSGDDSARSALARRLRELRDSRWPDLRVTQAQLCDAFQVSVPLISSWESLRAPKIPPLPRLEKYAAFFATRRSLSNGQARLLPLSDMTREELDEHRALLDELTRLRQVALRFQAAGETAETAPARDSYEGPWHFADGAPITIICSQVPPEERAKIPYATPEQGDYIEIYKYSDLDSLFELHGHLRAANPRSLVTLRATEDLRSDDLTTHVVLLGGVDYNQVTASMLGRIELPVRQVPDWEGEHGPYFEVDLGGDTRRHYPRISRSGDSLQLLEDVAFFYRGANPDNVQRTLTICNGMYARGVYGAVRALTDERFRDRNAAYLRARFGAAESYCILTRVRIEGRVVVTPDWTLDAYRLHEWPGPTHGD